jgi:hypothetical protein
MPTLQPRAADLTYPSRVANADPAAIGGGRYLPEPRRAAAHLHAVRAAALEPVENIWEIASTRQCAWVGDAARFFVESA